MLAAAAALAIGSLFPFGKLVASDGKAATLAQFSGKTTIVYLRAQAPAESDVTAIRSLADISNEERPVSVAPVFRAAATSLSAFRKKYALPQLFSSDLGSSEVLLVNPKGRIVKSWTAPAESKIAVYVSDWLAGKSLSIGYEAIDPRPMLTAIPALQPAMTWMGLIGQAFRLRFPPPGNIARAKSEKGLIILFLSSRSAGMEIYAERIKKVAAKCNATGVSVLGLFPEYDETP